MNISCLNHLYAFSHSSYSILKEKVLFQLTDQHKKIVLIATVAFALIAACYAIQHWCSKKEEESLVEDKPLPEEKVISKTKTDPDGTVYKGKLKDGKANGHGKYTSPDETIISESECKDDTIFTPIAKQPSIPIYDSAMHAFTNRDPQAEPIATQFQTALSPASLKNIQAACLFGDWKEMGFNIDIEHVKKGKELTLLEKMATEMPELGNALFLNIRGNGECGYRTIVNGLIYNDCIRHNHIDGLKDAFQQAFDLLIESWNTLPFDLLKPAESKLFKTSKDQALTQLDRMQAMPTADRMALLQEEAPFLAPFLSLIRCIAVSQTKLIDRENDTLSKRTLAHAKRINEILMLLKDKVHFTEAEEKNVSYALQNYSLKVLLSEDELHDIIGNASQNLMKEEFKALVQRAHLADPTLLNELTDLMSQEHELSNQQNILAASSIEMLDMGLTLDEFLKQKALGDANSPRSLWAIGSDFTAIGYALNKNICCIYKDQYKENAFGIQKTYNSQAADFYGLNMTGQAHYNALLPLMPS